MSGKLKVLLSFLALFALTFIALWFTVEIDETVKNPEGAFMVFFQANKFEAISYFTAGISCIYMFLYTLVKYGVKIKNKQFKKIDIIKVLGILIILCSLACVCYLGYMLSSHTVYK